MIIETCSRFTELSWHIFSRVLQWPPYFHTTLHPNHHNAVKYLTRYWTGLLEQNERTVVEKTDVILRNYNASLLFFHVCINRSWKLCECCINDVRDKIGLFLFRNKWMFVYLLIYQKSIFTSFYVYCTHRCVINLFPVSFVQHACFILHCLNLQFLFVEANKYMNLGLLKWSGMHAISTAGKPLVMNCMFHCIFDATNLT
jgi:hypothetical protein